MTAAGAMSFSIRMNRPRWASEAATTFSSEMAETIPSPGIGKRVEGQGRGSESGSGSTAAVSFDDYLDNGKVNDCTDDTYA